MFLKKKTTFSVLGILDLEMFGTFFSKAADLIHSIYLCNNIRTTGVSFGTIQKDSIKLS